jgi:hypothetical protein
VNLVAQCQHPDGTAAPLCLVKAQVNVPSGTVRMQRAITLPPGVSIRGAVESFLEDEE